MSIAIGQSYAASKGYVARNTNADAETIKGFIYTQPDILPEGLNAVTGGNFGGILNLLGKYDPVTGEAPVSNWSIIA